MIKESRREQKIHERELKEFLDKIPPPTPEHTAELKMERKLKRLIEEKQRTTRKKSKQK